MNKTNITFVISTLALAVASMFFISKQVNNAANRIERRIDFLEYRINGKTPESIREPTLEARLKYTNGLLSKMVDFCTDTNFRNSESEPAATEGGEQ